MRASNETKSKNRDSSYELLRLVCEESAHQTKDIFAGQISQQAQRMRADIERVAKRPFNILITGETGTGKTQIARQIHRLSVRASNPLIELNCANLPEQLVEAELFGHRRGAFTGADHDRKGLFEEADGGVLFLDEIGDIDSGVQSRLLKAIEEKQIKRLGTNHYQSCDVQIVAATSRNLPKMVRNREFREDLYSRLAVLTIETTPLRERREDIPAMIALFLNEAACAVLGPAKKHSTFLLEDGAVELLREFDYPGNIRSLRNLVFELTSYLDDMDQISTELVQLALARLDTRLGHIDCGVKPERFAHTTSFANDLTALHRTENDLAELQLFVNSIAREGDTALPLELCILRRGETFKEWTARAKRCAIEAIHQTTGATMEVVAQRLGLTAYSLKGHLQRARRDQNPALFEWRRESGKVE